MAWLAMRNRPVRKQDRETSDRLDAFAEGLQEQIMEEVRRTYSRAVIDHWMNPRNFGKAEGPDGYGRVTGPCGDTMEIFLKVEDDKIAAASFVTDGCGTTIACGSMATELAQGKAIGEAWKITQGTILQACGGLPEPDRHCALLAVDALQSALKNYQDLSRSPWKRDYRTI